MTDLTTDTRVKSVGMGISIAEPVDICPAEHHRRLALYDARLLPPKTAPFMVGSARRSMRARGSTPAPV